MKTVGGTIIRGEENKKYQVIGIRKSKNEEGIELEFIFDDKTHPDGVIIETIFVPKTMAKTTIKLITEKKLLD